MGGLEVGQQFFELWDLRRVHREGVGGCSQNRVEQGHVRRMLGVVASGVVVAEDEVFEERAIGVLHREVALVDHEVDEALIDLWHGAGRFALRVRSFHVGRRGGVPHRFLGELLAHEQLREPNERTEDRAPHIEVRHALHRDPPSMIDRSPGGDCRLALQVQRGL